MEIHRPDQRRISQVCTSRQRRPPTPKRVRPGVGEEDEDVEDEGLEDVEDEEDGDVAPEHGNGPGAGGLPGVRGRRNGS